MYVFHHSNSSHHSLFHKTFHVAKQYRFCKENPGELHKTSVGGWHLKAGFSTGGKNNLSTKKAKRIPRLIKSLFNRKGRRPYVMVQETMASTRVSTMIDI